LTPKLAFAPDSIEAAPTSSRRFLYCFDLPAAGAAAFPSMSFECIIPCTGDFFMKFKIFLRPLFYASRPRTVLRIKLMPKKRALRQPHASSSKKGEQHSLFSICAVPNCQFIPRTVFFFLSFALARRFIYTPSRVVQFVVVLCWFHHTLHNDMAHNKIMLCSLSLPRVFSRDLKPVVCSCESEREKTPKGAIQIWQCARFNFVLRPEF